MNVFALARPVLHRLPPERAHRLTIWGLKHGLAPQVPPQRDPVLEQTLWGRRFANPLGLAAGFDKDAEAVGPLFDLGFGFVEVGSITPRPQPGNPRPRVFRLPDDRGVINRLGFNSAGLDVAEQNLRDYRANRETRGVIGANLGKNRDSTDAAADYAAGARRLAPLADYLVLNVSSPNTPGLRALQGRAELQRLIDRVRAVRDDLALTDPPPILLKIAPDLTEGDMSDIATVANGGGVEGLIISNTTIERPDSLSDSLKFEKGGLSGRPLFSLSTDRLRQMYRLTKGKLPLVGVGGVESIDTAMAKISAGASLLQLYTALIYQGYNILTNVINGISNRIRYQGYGSISEVVGRDA